MPKGGAILLTATINPSEAREIGATLADSGVHLIDSPVSGGYPGAQGGTLTMMAAAPDAVLDAFADNRTGFVEDVIGALADTESARHGEAIRDMVAENHLPDYEIALDDRDIVHVTPRGLLVEATGLPPMPAEVLAAAREAAPGYDVHGLEADWRGWWMASGRPALRAPDRAFLAFCARRHATKPLR